MTDLSPTPADIIISFHLQILRVVARKVRFNPSIDFEDLALRTEGYSGADLQAIVYNAHLEVVHETLEQESASKNNNDENGHAVGEDDEHIVENGNVANGLGASSIDYKGKGKARAEQDDPGVASATSHGAKPSDKQPNDPSPLEFFSFGGGEDDEASRHQSREEKEKVQNKVG